MAASALLITGIIVSLMFEQYLTAHAQTGVFTRSRLWWEVVLNLQVLSAAMMWFSYSDEIEAAGEGSRGWLYVRRLFGVLPVLVPTFIAAIGVFHNWMEIKPRGDIIAGVFILALAHWLSAVALRLVIDHKAARQRKKKSVAFYVFYFSPLISLSLLGMLCWATNDLYWVMLAPFLLYLQASAPFLKKVFSGGKNGQPRQDGA